MMVQYKNRISQTIYLIWTNLRGHLSGPDLKHFPLLHIKKFECNEYRRSTHEAYNPLFLLWPVLHLLNWCKFTRQAWWVNCVILHIHIRSISLVNNLTIIIIESSFVFQQEFCYSHKSCNWTSLKDVCVWILFVNSLCVLWAQSCGFAYLSVQGAYNMTINMSQSFYMLLSNGCAPYGYICILTKFH